jgi:hypothetical protein
MQPHQAQTHTALNPKMHRYTSCCYRPTQELIYLHSKATFHQGSKSSRRSAAIYEYRTYNEFQKLCVGHMGRSRKWVRARRHILSWSASHRSCSCTGALGPGGSRGVGCCCLAAGAAPFFPRFLGGIALCFRKILGRKNLDKKMK